MEPQVIGSNFRNAQGRETIFTPAENTGGMIVRTATIHCGFGFAILATGTALPPAFGDLTVPVVLTVRSDAATSSSYSGSSATLPFPVIIPAGKGLYFSGDSSQKDRAYVTYDPVV
ncbi:hypothetical protein [Pseudomonas sp. TMB3-21]